MLEIRALKCGKMLDDNVMECKKNVKECWIKGNLRFENVYKCDRNVDKCWKLESGNVIKCWPKMSRNVKNKSVKCYRMLSNVESTKCWKINVIKCWRL